MTHQRRAIHLGSFSPCHRFIQLLVVHLALASTATLSAQDTIQAPGQAPVAVQDTLVPQDSTEVEDSTAVEDSTVAAAAAMTRRAEGLATDISVLWIEIDTLYQKFTQALGEERLVLDGQVTRRADVLRLRLADLTAGSRVREAAGLEPRCGFRLRRIGQPPRGVADIRRARPDDAPALLELAHAAFLRVHGPDVQGMAHQFRLVLELVHVPLLLSL